MVRHLASGGMAELYIARQEAMGGFEKQVVLKLLQPRYAENPRVVTDVPRRGAAGRQAQPPGHRARLRRRRGRRPQVHRDGVHPRRDARRHRQARARGRTTTCRSSTPSTSSARRRPGWPTRTSAASADGHVLRIVHRDVSPTNILVSYEGQTKIVDFGIARAQDELREESGIAPGQGVVHVARAGARRAGSTTARTSSRWASSCTS